MEEGSQSSNGERGQSSEWERSDHGYVKERSFDSSEHRSRVCNLMNNTLNGEAKETLKQDRISILPDSIRLHILSFLPTKDAIKTNALSQRWLDLWTYTPNLHFACTSWGSDPTNEFVSFVNKTIHFHRHCRLKKFIVVFFNVDMFAPLVDTWVHFATTANVEELCLLLSWGYRRRTTYVLPQYLYTNSSSMTTLRFTACHVVPNGLISWKSLKSLFIGDTVLSNDVIQKIFVGAPVLESMELYGCWGFTRLDIGSANLRKLVVGDYWAFWRAENEVVLEISAPNLQSLGIFGEIHRNRLRLMNIQSLDDCHLNFEVKTSVEDYDNDFEELRNMVGELLDRLRHVKKLTMGNWCIQVLSISELKGMLSSMPNCKCLILDMYRKCDILGIGGLLLSCLNLETLVINTTSLYGLTSLNKYVFDEDFLENYWSLESRSSKCSLLHLKNVKIVGFTGRHRESELVILLVRFLLEKTGTLEKIIIDVRTGMKCPPKKLFELSSKFTQNLAQCSSYVL